MSKNTVKIAVSIRESDHPIIKAAADHLGLATTAFCRAAALQRARQVIAEAAAEAVEPGGQRPWPEVIGALAGHLGDDLLGRLIYVETAAVHGWTRLDHPTMPSAEQQQLLRELEALVRQVAATDPPGGVRTWVYAHGPGFWPPAHLISHDGIEGVRLAALQFRQGQQTR